jgi:hypothetical protein
MLGNDNNNKLELITGTNTTLSLTNSGSTNSVSSSTALSITEFSHIVGIIQDSSMNLYIDNTLVGSVSITIPFELNTFSQRIIWVKDSYINHYQPVIGMPQYASTIYNTSSSGGLNGVLDNSNLIYSSKCNRN